MRRAAVLEAEAARAEVVQVEMETALVAEVRIKIVLEVEAVPAVEVRTKTTLAVRINHLTVEVIIKSLTREMVLETEVVPVEVRHRNRHLSQLQILILIRLQVKVALITARSSNFISFLQTDNKIQKCSREVKSTTFRLFTFGSISATMSLEV